MLVTTETKSVVTLPKSAKAMIVNVNCEGIIKAILPAGIESDMRVTPRMISMSHESARASMGAKATAKSFVHGLAYLTCAFSHGQGSLEQLGNGMPKHSAFALEMACAMFKHGAGSCTASDLTASVQSAIGKLLALPAKEKTRIENKPTIAGVIVTDAIDELDQAGIDKANSRADVQDLRADAMNADSLHDATAEHAAKLAEEAAIEKAAKVDVDIVAILQGFAVNRPEYAIEQLKLAAHALGYDIRKIPAKRA